MKISVKKLHPQFMAEIDDIDLTETLSDAQFEAIKVNFDEHAVLLFRNQLISDDNQIAFTKLFGPIIKNTNYHRPGEILRISNDLSDVSNLDHNGNLLPLDSGRRLHSRANRLWHTDASFKHIPARCSILSAHEVPPVGGNTAFADMRAAYDAYSFKVIPEIGARVANDRESYQYLVESIRRFPDQKAFAAMIAEAGFGQVGWTNFSGGVAAMHTGRAI